MQITLSSVLSYLLPISRGWTEEKVVTWTKFDENLNSPFSLCLFLGCFGSYYLSFLQLDLLNSFAF